MWWMERMSSGWRLPFWGSCSIWSLQRESLVQVLFGVVKLLRQTSVSIAYP